MLLKVVLVTGYVKHQMSNQDSRSKRALGRTIYFKMEIHTVLAPVSSKRWPSFLHLCGRWVNHRFSKTDHPFSINSARVRVSPDFMTPTTFFPRFPMFFAFSNSLKCNSLLGRLLFA